MQSRPHFAKTLRLLAAAALSLGAAGSIAAPPAEPPHIVQAPHYGDGLFYFYQERYFSSITSLMVSQHFERLPHHEDEAEILRGGLMLSFGLHREAGDIFARLIEKGGVKPSVRDRAWFYLAKIRYQRGFNPEAEQALTHIEGKLPGDLEEDRALLLSNLLMAREDYAGAVTALNTFAAAKDANRYIRFNLGVALVKSGDVARGTTMLDELGKAPAENEEIRALRDKANVALGFTALQENRAELARTYLERVRLNGMQSNKALLGFGWAAASLKKPNLALVPWEELVKRDISDSAVLEARIAVPYAYAELGAYGQSLQLYNEAIAAFEAENAGLDESIAAIRGGKLISGLMSTNPGEEMGWFWKIERLPDMPHAGHLTQVLAQHEFQEAFKNFRDLRFLATNLEGWRDNLGVFSDMLTNRRNAYAERLPKVLERAKDIGLDALQRRRDVLAEELKQAEDSQDGVAFADEKERDLMERLQSVQAALKQLGDDPEFASARERARLAQGALVWRLSQEYPSRVWDAQKGMKATDAGLDEARRRDAALAQAQKDEPARHEAFAKRIAELDKRIQALIPQVAQLTKEQQQVVQEIAVAELVRQKERLQGYTMQARFAVAQLYDRANSAKEADHAGKP